MGDDLPCRRAGRAPPRAASGTQLDAIVTDPPYSSGGAFRGDRTLSTVAKYVQSGTAAYRPEFAGDNRDQRSFLAWYGLWLAAAAGACRPGAFLGVFTDWRQLPVTSDAVQVGGFTWRGIAVWAKPFGRPTPGRFTNAAEYLVWGSLGPMEAREVYPRGVFEASSPTGTRLHVAQKPETVMQWALAPVAPGSLVCDPFMGSGTTLVAAKALGIRAIGVDSDPAYCEIAATRCSQESLPLS